MNFIAFFTFFAVILTLILTPIQSYIWNGESTPFYLLKMKEFILVFLKMKKEIFPETTDYYFFGRMAIFIHIGILLGLKELYKNGFFPESLSKILRFIAGILFLATLGDLIAYWGGSFFGESFRNIGFRWLEAPSIFLLLFAIGYLGFKMRMVKKWEGTVFVSLPFLMIGSTLFFRYIPHGSLLPILFVVTGFVLSSPSASALQKISRRFESISSVKSILIFFVLAVLCSQTMQILEKSIPISESGILPKKMDFRPFSSAKDFVEVFGTYGEQGRFLYFWIDIVDMIFPIPLSLCFAGIYTRVALETGLPISFNLLPLGFLVFDLVENSLMFYFLASWPIVSEPLAAITGAVTAIKLFFLFVGFIMFFVSSLILISFWIREKRNKLSAG